MICATSSNRGSNHRVAVAAVNRAAFAEQAKRRADCPDRYADCGGRSGVWRDARYD